MIRVATALVLLVFLHSGAQAAKRETAARPRSGGSPDSKGGPVMQFTVGLKAEGRVQHRIVEAEDALIAALKVKCEHPEALILYVRRQNRRGDARHPPLGSEP
jgi:hypothetical protein